MSGYANSEWNRKRREKLHKEQGGVCFYCRHRIGVYVGDERDPVLDHHKPQSRGGGRRHLVLACAWCDRRKGMLDGHEFIALINSITTDRPLTERHRIAISGAAKSRNLALQTAHQESLTAKAKAAISATCLSHAEITLAVANDSGNAGAANTRLGDAAENK